MAESTAFEFYKLLIEEVREARRARRELANVFMSLNLAGVGALGFLAKDAGELNPALAFWCAFALVLTCFIWRSSNAYYTYMLAAKYEAIYALEEELGRSPMRDEWLAIGAARKRLKSFTLERAMPMLFILGYGVFVAVQFCGPQMHAAIEWAGAEFWRLVHGWGI